MIDGNRKIILDAFLSRWPLDTVRNMTLEEYTGLKNKDTFCQWVETKTRTLGSIKGVQSTKFSIYQTRKSKAPTGYKIINGYCSSKKEVSSNTNTFIKIRGLICELIEAAQSVDFDAIDQINLHAYFKWKIAALYSNGVISPIFNFQVVKSLAIAFEAEYKYGKAAAVLEKVMLSMPDGKCRFQYAFDLFNQFYLPANTTKTEKQKSEASQLRKFKKSHYTAQQIHSKIQNELHKELSKLYPGDDIRKEDKNVDLTKESNREFIFYEVKSSPSPTYCIREALGQVLNYAFKRKTTKKKKIVVVGRCIPNGHELKFIKYLQSNLSIQFEYLAISPPLKSPL
jgi:hypothetical protein